MLLILAVIIFVPPVIKTALRIAKEIREA